MKKIHFLFVSIFYSMSLFAQTPQFFRYQCVVRDGAGVAVVNQSVNFQISIISGSTGGTVEYTETHGTATNPFGIATLEIGNGTPVTGSFAAISWGTAPHFVKVEADPTGGTTYIDMGTTQLLSVPYALYSEQAGNVQTYSAGNGISISGNVITNEAPDQAVTISSGNGILVTGSYPAFSVENTQPDQAVTLTPGGATAISGTYPNFTISSTDQNTGTPGGLNKTLQFNDSGSFGGDTNLIWDNSNKRLGLGVTNPFGRVVIQGSQTALANEPLFEIRNRFGQQIMVVYEDSVHFYISDDVISSNKGGFAVSGRNNAKAFTNNYLTVTPDSTRIFTGDTLSGFGVANIGTTVTTNYMQLTPNNYFIGHEAGKSNVAGLFNSFIGYQSGFNNNSGNKNYFIGYRSGYNNFVGFSNIFIGDSAGFSNNNGNRNVFIGNQSGFSNTAGGLNVFIGYQAGYSNNSGGYNTAIGMNSLYSNVGGVNNTAIGTNSLYYNTSGNSNTANGRDALYRNTTGYQNTANGESSLWSNTTGYNNTASGEASLRANTTGYDNTSFGYWSLYSNTTGIKNTALGWCAYVGGTFDNSTAIGAGANINASNKVRIGDASVTVIEGQVAYTFPSDGRFKNNVTEEVKGLDFINRLRPVVYNFDTRLFDEFLMKDIPDSIKKKIMLNNDYNQSSNIRQSGFIAQEVELAAKESGYDFNGVHKPVSDKDNYSIAYSLLTVPLVKAVQEQNVIIEEQKVQIQELKATNDELLQKYNSLKSEIDLVKTMINNQEIK